MTRAQADEESPTKSVKVEIVRKADERRSIIGALQRGLEQSRNEAKIDRCDLVVTYVEQMPSGHDSSFGAVCHVRAKGKSVALTMCDDWFVGKFTLSPGVTDKAGLGEFIGRNCPPGG